MLIIIFHHVPLLNIVAVQIVNVSSNKITICMISRRHSSCLLFYFISFSVNDDLKMSQQIFPFKHFAF